MQGIVVITFHDHLNKVVWSSNLAIHLDVNDGLLSDFFNFFFPFIARLSFDDLVRRLKFGVAVWVASCFGLAEELFRFLKLHRLVFAHLESLHLLPFQFLHEFVAAFELYLVLLYLLPQEAHLPPHLLVLLEQFVGLRLEVVQLVTQLPYLIFRVLVLDGLVEFLHHFLSLLPHLFYFSFHYRKHLVLVVLHPSNNVLVHRVYNLIHLLEVLLNCLFWFLQRGTGFELSWLLEESEERFPDSPHERIVSALIFASEWWIIPFYCGRPQKVHPFIFDYNSIKASLCQNNEKESN